MILSNNKSGTFYKQFEEDIDKREENLPRILEIIELLMVVQSKWGYLESIFTSQQDIMKQLSQEHTIFKGVNTGFRAELERINKDRNALRALHSSWNIAKNSMKDKKKTMKKILDLKLF